MGETQLVLEGYNAVIYGGSGAIGFATARAMAAEGAHVCLVGRTESALHRAATTIMQEGGSCEIAVLDVFDAKAAMRQAADYASRRGGIDIALNAISVMHDQGTLLADLSVEAFLHPVEGFLRALFNATRAAAPHMGRERTGVVLTLSTPAGITAPPGHLGYGVTCAATEAFTVLLAAELAAQNTRAVCIRSHAISDAPAAGSYTGALFERKASALGLTVDAWLDGAAASTLRGKLPTLNEVAGAAVYQPQHVMDPDDLAALDPLTEIADAPGTIYLGALRHIFEFDVDGHIYRVSVEGRTVKTLRVA